MAKEQERQEEGETSPHPGLEALWTPGEEEGESLSWDQLRLSFVQRRMSSTNQQNI